MPGAIVLLSQVVDDIVVLQQYMYRLNDNDLNILMVDYGKGGGLIPFDKISDDNKDKALIDGILTAEAIRNPTAKAFLRWDKSFEASIDKIDMSEFWLARGLWVTAIDGNPIASDEFFALVDEGSHTLTIMVKLRDDRNGTEYEATVLKTGYFSRGKSYRMVIEMDLLNRKRLEDQYRNSEVDVSFFTSIFEY
jgi:hypothetical protein